MSEGFYLSRVEQPQWFKAPSNMEANCRICGDIIKPGQIIGESNDEYFHEDCMVWQIEDQMEDAL